MNEPPSKIAHFELFERLGSGAMGVVYRARDTLLKRQVALKLIRPERVEDRETRGRFLRECQAAASINHPGIATVFEAGETEDGTLFFVSELIEGESLQEKIQRGPLPPDEVIEIGIQLGEALSAAHAQDIVHRDIKPANLMILPDGRVKVLDFGLARLLAPEEDRSDEDSLETVTQTRVGVVVGTPAYMSPEQASGAAVDARTDIFAGGSVLYAAASGREAFLTGSVPETLRRIIAEEPPPLESIDPAIPHGLRSVIRRALAKDRSERYASAADFADALRATRTASATSLDGAVPTTPRPRSRILRTTLALAATVALVVTVVLVTLQFGRPGLAFGSRDKLLIASVDNQTQDEAFDLALRTALEADLQQSRYAGVFDQGQVAQTLRLMRLDPSTPVDEELGRDICRFAGIRALLLPRILSVGEAYEIQVVIVDPVSGRHVEIVRVTARGREEVLLEGIDKVTREVRSRLGESLTSIEEADFPIVQVTTSSWEALQYLTMGNMKWQQQKYVDAGAMFALALQKDPLFVTAKGSLGLLQIQFLDQPEEGKQLLAQALEEGSDLPEREFLMIRAVHRQFVEEDLERALDEYELISEIYPDMMQPYNNAGRILQGLGRLDEAAAMYEAAAEVDPRDVIPLANLFWLRLNAMRQPRAAEAVARRRLELAPANADFRSQLAWSLVAQQRLDDALPELRRVLADEPRHPYALPNLAHVLYVTGRPEEALPYYRQLLRDVNDGKMQGSRTISTRELALALRDAGLADEANERVRVELEQLDAESAPATAWDFVLRAQLNAIVGRGDEAERLVAGALALGALDANVHMDLARVYAQLDRPDEALGQIALAYERGYWDAFFPLIMPGLKPLQGDPRFVEMFATED